MSRSRGGVLPVLLGLLLVLPGSVATLVVRQARDTAVAPAAAPYGVRLSRGEVPDDAAAADYRRRRVEGVRATLAARSRALLARDEKAFLATVDQRDVRFVARQERLFRGVAKLDFASFGYEVDPAHEYLPYTIRWERYGGADVYLPALTLTYALRGFDPKPVARAVQMTFVERDGRWLLGGDGDVTSGPENADDPWDVSEVEVAKGARALVIGHPDDDDLLPEIAKLVDAAIPHVTRGWGGDWPERVVVVAPRDTRLFESLFRGSSLGFDDVAAVAVAQYGVARDRLGAAPPVGADRFPVAGRIVVNPENVELDADEDGFLPVLLRHEITHVAQFTLPGDNAPKWLTEGFADWVAYESADVPATVVADTARHDVAEGRLPVALPFDTDFGYTGEAAVAYEYSWLACAFIAERYGPHRLRELYRSVAREVRPLTVPVALKRMFGLDEAGFLAAWHAWLKTELR